MLAWDAQFSQGARPDFPLPGGAAGGQLLHLPHPGQGSSASSTGVETF